MNWEEYRSYNSPLSYLQYKNGLVHNRRLKREKPNVETPLIAGRLLLDSPQAFDSIREDSQNGKRTAKSFQSVGSHDKSLSTGDSKTERDAVADIRHHINYILEQLHNLELKSSDSNCKVKKDTNGISVNSKSTEHKTNKENKEANSSDKEEAIFDKAGKETNKKAAKSENKDENYEIYDNDEVEEDQKNIGKECKGHNHKSFNKFQKSKKSNDLKHKNDNLVPFEGEEDDVKEISESENFLKESQLSAGSIPSLAPYKQLLESQDHMELSGGRPARQNSEQAPGAPSSLSSTQSPIKSVREVNVKVRRWDDWTQWSACSVTCGKGRQIRWRHCVLKDCSEAETEMDEKACQLPACGSKFLQLFGAA